MDTIFSIDHNLDIPIYQQLVDKIRAAIKGGVLTAGQQLPTVQDLSARLSVARGTVKRAYSDLEHEGLIEKVQGRGTFIRYQPFISGNRKEQATAAIDKLLDQLESMGFSATEISIFLDLKLQERREELSHLKIAVVECNHENLAQLSDQIRDIRQADLYTFLIDSIMEYPYKIDTDTDLIVTTNEHAHALESVLTDKKRIVRIALRLSFSSLSRIIKLRSGSVVGILGYSPRFGELLYNTCQVYNQGIELTPAQVFLPDMDIESYLAGKDAVLVPNSYERYCRPEIAQSLKKYSNKADLIPCFYEMDEGSSLFLEERIKRALDEKLK